MNAYIDEIEQFASSHETSIEVVEAIFKIATSPADAERIWQAPTRTEMNDINWYLNTEYPDAEWFYWGEAKIPGGNDDTETARTNL